MKRSVPWIPALIGALVIAGIAWYAAHRQPQAPQPEPSPVETPAPPAAPPQTSAEPQIRHPIEAPQNALPPLAESDSAIRDALASLVGDRSLLALLKLDTFVRRVVATVDNLPRRKLAPRLMPVKPASGAFVTGGSGDTLVMSDRNYARYAPYVRLLDVIDAQKLAAVYMRFYPLFQQAYQDLGYPQGYFNDRLVEAIDDMLAAPAVDAPVKLVRPKVYYLYADPELEALSAGQKILIRIGPDNAAKAKAKLRAIRAELVGKTSVR
jgi:hypothetical protein